MRSLIKYTFLFLLAVSNPARAQEKIIGLTSNGIIRDYYKQHLEEFTLKSMVIPDTLELPFFDDFSRNTIYPDPVRWEDPYAFVNFTYAVNPISIGVVTLDAIDETGAIYPHANSIGFVADHLTSKPINLDYPASAGIYLSFYYQPKGLADAPSLKDSILLEFYSPADTTWDQVWSAPGDTLHPFRQVHVAVDNPKFLKKGFRFRFKNFASLTADLSVPDSRITNNDHWHLDYIRLDKNRNINDTIPNDVAMVEPIRSALKNYEAMPWDHFRETFLSEMGSSIPISYTNHDDSTRQVTRLFIITDVYENTISHAYSGGAANISPWETINYSSGLFYTYNSLQADSALFEVKAFLITDEFDRKINDTITYYQRFRDYFAYDDGSAESGYGNLSDNARIACQFTSFIPDSLYAVRIHFNRSYHDASQRYFTLTVWGDNNGVPGEILYSQENVQPEYGEGLTGFHTYTLDTPVYVSGEFYVGWQQISDTYLNFGFDLNRIHNDKIFIQIGGDWTNSSFPGALMIRPVVNRSVITSEIPVVIDPPIRLYPNPASSYIKLEYPDKYIEGEGSLVIYDSYGRRVFHTVQPEKMIDLTGFVPGLYILRIYRQEQVVSTGKFIIIR